MDRGFLCHLAEPPWRSCRPLLNGRRPQTTVGQWWQFSDGGRLRASLSIACMVVKSGHHGPPLWLPCFDDRPTGVAPWGDGDHQRLSLLASQICSADHCDSGDHHCGRSPWPDDHRYRASHRKKNGDHHHRQCLFCIHARLCFPLSSKLCI